MRSLLLLCALTACLLLVCKPSERRAVVASEPALAAAPQELTIELPATATKPSLLSLLTLGVAVLGAVSSQAAESPIDANAQLATRIVDTTAQLEASAARVADARAR